MRSPEEVWADGPAAETTDTTGKKDPWSLWGMKPEEPVPERTWAGTAKDIGVAGLKSAVGAVETGVGLADMVTGGYAGKLAEKAGLRIKEANDILDDQYSDAQKAANKRVDDAGKDDPSLVGRTLAKAGAMAKNPSTIAQTVVESLGSIGAGGVEARGLMMLPKLRKIAALGAEGLEKAGIIAGAGGEALTSAGSTAEQVRQDSKDGTLTMAQSALAGGSGLFTGLLSYGGGKLAHALGLEDIDTAMAKGAKPKATTAAADAVAAMEQAEPAERRSWALRVLGGATSEGLIEELPQSAQEQIAQNWATGKAWDDGLDKAMAGGALAGAAMGGGVNAMPGHGHTQNDTTGDATPPPQQAPVTQSQQLARQAYAQVSGAGAAVDQLSDLRSKIAISLAGMDDQERQTAIAHLSAGDNALAGKMAEDAKNPDLLNAGRSATLIDPMQTGRLDVNESIRVDSGLIDQDAAQPPTANAVADKVNQQADQQAQPQQQGNSAGYVPEPAGQVQAQIEAVKQGRKPVAVMGEEEFKQADVRGLHYGRAVDPQSGETAVVVSVNPALIEAAVSDTQQSGLKAAMGKALGYVNPDLTGAPQPGAAVVQHVDNNTGHILKEEVVHPHQAGQVQAMPGTSLRLTNTEQALAQRVAQAQEAAQSKPEAPSSGPAAAATSFHGGVKSVYMPPKDVKGKVTAFSKELAKNYNTGRPASNMQASDVEHIEHPPGDLGRLARAVKWATGSRVEFVRGEKLPFWGLADRVAGYIALHIDNPHPLQTLGHELAHALEAKHPDLYAKLEDVVFARMRADRARKLQVELQKSMGERDGMKRHQAVTIIRSELVAEAIGELSQSPRFWTDVLNEIAQDRKINMIERFVGFMKELFSRLQAGFTRHGYTTGMKDMQIVMKAWQSAYREWANRHAAETKAEADKWLAEHPEEVEKAKKAEASKKDMRDRVERAKTEGWELAMKSPFADRIKALVKGFTDLGEKPDFMVGAFGGEALNGKLTEETVKFREDNLRKQQAQKAGEGKPKPKVAADKVAIEGLRHTIPGQPAAGAIDALPKEIKERAVEVIQGIADKLAELGFKVSDHGNLPPEAKTLRDQITRLVGDLHSLVGRRYAKLTGKGSKKSQDKTARFLPELEKDVSKVLGIDTTKHPGVNMDRAISPLGDYTAAEIADPVKRLLATIRRFGSGLSSIKDLESGGASTMGLQTRGIGVVAGELSKKAIDSLANAVVNQHVAAFIDSGAFGVFVHNVSLPEKNAKRAEEGKKPLQPLPPIDFDKLLNTYDDIEQAIGEARHDAGEPDDHTPVLVVMPDVVGDQKASIGLIEKHKKWVSGQSASRLMRPIIPIQKGDLTLTEAYDQIKKIIGHDDFIVGVPSNKEAISAEEFTQFLKDSKPKAVHILGAASDTRLLPRLQSIVDAGMDGKMEVTADASQILSTVVPLTNTGWKRKDAIDAAHYNKDDPTELKHDNAPSEPKQPRTPPIKSEAPEHTHVGVDDRELGQITSAFKDAQEASIEDEEKVHHLFDAPRKDEIVRLADKAKVYHKDHGWMTPAQAKAKIAEWKKHAADQGKTRANSEKVVLSLFDLTGKWSQPWEEAGYQVYRFDIQDESTYTDPETGEEKRIGDVTNFSTEFFNDIFGSFDGNDVHAILAACPCTDFASSGARHFAAKDADGRTVASVKLVHMTLATVEYFKPSVWAIENPVGRIEKLGSLPPWRLSFNPNELGDPYTKKTLLWGRFNADLPIAPVAPTEGSKMHSQYGGKSLATKNARSVTPEGFAYGFFMANNAIDNPVMTVANKYDRLNKSLISQAIEAGVTPQQIDHAVQDHYYQELDDEAGNEALKDLIAEKTGERPEHSLAPSAKQKEDGKADRQRYLDGIEREYETGGELTPALQLAMDLGYRGEEAVSMWHAISPALERYSPDQIKTLILSSGSQENVAKNLEIAGQPLYDKRAQGFSKQKVELARIERLMQGEVEAEPIAAAQAAPSKKVYQIVKGKAGKKTQYAVHVNGQEDSIYQTRKEAEAFIRADKGLPALKEAPKKKPAGGRNAALASYEKNPFLTFLAEHGLFHIKGDPKSQKTEFSPDKAISVPGYHVALFRRDGKMPDLLLQPAIEEGYLPQGATESQLEDLIRRAVNGQRIAPLYGEGQAEKEAERQLQARIDDAQAAVDEGNTYDAIVANALLDSDGIPWDTDTDHPRAAALRSMGFSDEEIDQHEADAAERSRLSHEDFENGVSLDEAPEGASEGYPAGEDQSGEEEGLTRPSLEDILAQQERADRGNKAEAKANKDAEAKAKADAEVGEYRLTGSDRAADANPDQTTFLQRNALKMHGVMDVIGTTRTGKLPLDLGDAISRDNVGETIRLAKQPDQRKKLMRKIMDKAIETLADYLIPVKRWIDGLNISNNLKQRLTGDMYRADTVRAGLEKEVADTYSKPLFNAIEKAARATKMTTDQIKTLAGYWMTAKYAPKANALLLSKDRAAERYAQAKYGAILSHLQQQGYTSQQIAQNPTLQRANAELQEALNNTAMRQADIAGAIGAKKTRGVGGGMNNAEAAEIVRNVEAKIAPAMLAEIARPIYNMMAWKKRKDLDTGRVTPDQVMSWPNHPDYVPMTGDPRATRDDADLFDTGNQVNQSGEMAMNGRKDSVAENAIDTAFAATVKSINHAAMQDFKRSLMGAYTESVQQGIDPGVKIESVTGIIRNSDNVVIYRDAFQDPLGKWESRAYAFRFDDDRVASALKKDSMERANSVLEVIGKPTRIYGRLVTQFAPMFAPINMVRDIWERTELLRVRKLYAANGSLVNVDKVARASIADTMNPAVWQATWGKATHNGKMTQVRGDLEEMIRLGGNSIWGDFLARRQEDLEREMRQHTRIWNKALGKINHVTEVYNTTFELVPALAIYRNLKLQGMEAKDAAAAALDLMNFKKKGTAMPALRALYIFAQPAATSGYNLAQYLSTRKGQIRFAAQTAVGIMLYAFLRGVWGDDDDEEVGNKLDNLGNNTLERSLPVKLGDHVVKFPVGFGPPQLAWITAANMVRLATGRYNATDALMETAKSWVKSAAPVQASDIELSKRPVDWFIQTFMPTVTKPIVQIAQDQNAFGAPLTPVFKDPNKLKSEQAKRTTPQWYTDVAREIQDTFGLDVYPDQIKMVMDSYMVDPLTRVARQILVENPAKNERGEPSSIPVLASLVDAVNDRQLLNQTYYRLRDDLQNAAQKYNSDPEKYEELADKAQAFKRFETREKSLSQMRSALKRMRENLDPDEIAERSQNIEEMSDEARRDVLKAYLSEQ